MKALCPGLSASFLVHLVPGDRSRRAVRRRHGRAHHDAKHHEKRAQVQRSGHKADEQAVYFPELVSDRAPGRHGRDESGLDVWFVGGGWFFLVGSEKQGRNGSAAWAVGAINSEMAGA